MSIPGSLRYTCILLFSLLLTTAATAQEAATDTVADKPALPKIQAGHQLHVGFDIIRPAVNYFSDNMQSYEFTADYYLKNELYLAAEGGWGSSSVKYTDLAYNTSNTFFRFGFNKVLLPREHPKDWGGIMMGMRLGTTFIDRSAATYTITDSVWGNSTGTVASKQVNGIWAELNAGVRVELYKGIMAGWTLRGKFMLNSKNFNDLSPLYIAGYGRGDKNAVFDLNFYLGYAVRWKRK